VNVSLTPELELFVSAKVESGRYNSASEVVREALRLLEEHDTARATNSPNLTRNSAGGWPRSIVAKRWLRPRPAPGCSENPTSVGNRGRERLYPRLRCGPRSGGYLGLHRRRQH
jgi:putative addiction module CopG family antidote